MWRLARADERLSDLEPELAERAICGAGILASRQITFRESAAWPNPDLAAGAWFRDGITRMDDQQHALSGLALTEAILARQEDTP